VLYRIDVLLEAALREVWNVQAVNTLDVQIQRIRAEIKERVEVARKLEKEAETKGEMK
jgi:hypothetical protein